MIELDRLHRHGALDTWTMTLEKPPPKDPEDREDEEEPPEPRAGAAPLE
jgi:hypothetical protein